ncbi:ubiquitin-conjugating enzyme E2-16 kDa-like isoform X2 [Pecten maximus]|uniref:ubiquitin-conjugating enzyme E2-16 kDa-like isoform X2 n=1 Tax=Pecten maximus TaxID=6579 RepID=UPI001457F7A4|nr:ubiquitin-conjugating enzyme E2-16 kDa-like isoform X2 [Pecten maximus]
MASTKRLKKELLLMTRDPPENCSASLVNDDLFHWKASLLGPEETPYAGGSFVLDIRFPAEYPFKPPQVKFETKIYHRHIIDGEICMDLLHSKWLSTFTISTVLLAVSSLMADSNHQEPEFALRAKEWTDMHARPCHTREQISGPPSKSSDID